MAYGQCTRPLKSSPVRLTWRICLRNRYKLSAVVFCTSFRSQNVVKLHTFVKSTKLLLNPVGGRHISFLPKSAHASSESAVGCGGRSFDLASSILSLLKKQRKSGMSAGANSRIVKGGG